jgi:hypothetical protein
VILDAQTRISLYLRCKQAPSRTDRAAWCWSKWGKNHYLAFVGLAFFLRTSTDFAAAFFALAVRSSGVIVSRLRLPPIRPPFAPCFLKKSRTARGSLGLTSIA